MKPLSIHSSLVHLIFLSTVLCVDFYFILYVSSTFSEHVYKCYSMQLVNNTIINTSWHNNIYFVNFYRLLVVHLCCYGNNASFLLQMWHYKRVNIEKYEISDMLFNVVFSMLLIVQLKYIESFKFLSVFFLFFLWHLKKKKTLSSDNNI